MGNGVALFLMLAMVPVVVWSGCLPGMADEAAGTSVRGNPIFPPDAELRLNPDNGTLLYLKGTDLLPDMTGNSDAGRGPEAVAIFFMEHYRAQFLLAHPGSELKCLSVDTDALGLVHIRFQQTYNDLDVWGKEINVHLDQTRRVNLVQGRYVPTPRHVDTTPEISAADAVKKASAAAGLPPPHASSDIAELVIYAKPHENGTLAYKVALPGWMYFVDAKDGSLIDKIATRQSGRDIFTPIKK